MTAGRTPKKMSGIADTSPTLYRPATNPPTSLTSWASKRAVLYLRVSTALYSMITSLSTLTECLGPWSELSFVDGAMGVQPRQKTPLLHLLVKLFHISDDTCAVAPRYGL